MVQRWLEKLGQVRPNRIPILTVMSSGPIAESVMWKLRRAVIRQQEDTETHMVTVAPLALATWATWFALMSVPLLRMEVDYPKNCSLLRTLQERTAQVIGACALLQSDFLAAPFPDDMNPTSAYQEFVAELDDFPVRLEGRLSRVCVGFLPTVARYLNAVVEMFDAMGRQLDDRWMLKVADMAAEASTRCLLHREPPHPIRGPSDYSVVPGTRRDRAITLAHPAVQDSSDDSFQMSEPEPADS